MTTQTDGEAVLKEMVKRAQQSSEENKFSWVACSPNSIRAIAAHVDHLQSALKESIRLQGEYAAQVEQADKEHAETVELMRKMIAERDNEIACLTALKEQS